MVNKLGVNTPQQNRRDPKRSMGIPYDGGNVANTGSVMVQSSSGQSGIVMNHDQFKHTAIRNDHLNQTTNTNDIYMHISTNTKDK